MTTSISMFGVKRQSVAFLHRRRHLEAPGICSSIFIERKRCLAGLNMSCILTFWFCSTPAKLPQLLLFKAAMSVFQF